MVYQPKSAVGYRNLLTWKQAGEIYCMAKDFSRERLNRISDSRLIGHVNDSARSVQRNIEEGYKRATTKEYVQFLGFSRASLEELKGDFEEFKREWREGLRWVEKGEIRVRSEKGEAVGRSEKGEAVGRGEKGEAAGWSEKGEAAGRSEKGEAAGRSEKGEAAGRSEMRGLVIREIERLLDLIYGEDCMIGRQIHSLEEKMVAEKTLPRGEMIKRGWSKSGSGEKRFWGLVESRFGLIRGDRGVIRREDRGERRDEKGERRDEKGEIRDEKGESL